MMMQSMGDGRDFCVDSTDSFENKFLFEELDRISGPVKTRYRLESPGIGWLLWALRVSSLYLASRPGLGVTDVLPILSVVTNSYGFQFLTASGHQGRACIGSLGQRLLLATGTAGRRLIFKAGRCDGGLSELGAVEVNERAGRAWHSGEQECRAARQAGAEQERAWEGAAGVSEDARSGWIFGTEQQAGAKGTECRTGQQCGRRWGRVQVQVQGAEQGCAWSGAPQGCRCRCRARVLVQGVEARTAESSGEAGRAWRKKRGRRVRVQAVGAGVAAGTVTADEQERGGRAGARRRAGVQEEQERCRAGSIVQYHVFYMTQYQTIFDDKK
ncbi:hypothetical protein B0H14DRAFT_2654178 [Mycena olivaceomarginata]|nr:hypothetical protein B0H14DRAFT_2654178 [Mycena olivaceomarginata]